MYNITTRRLVSAILFLLIGSSFASAQETHIDSRYIKEIDRTVVRSDVLYVVDTPDQFIQLQLTGRYPKKGPPTEAPDRLSFEFGSFTRLPLYKLDESHRLAVKADDRILDLGLMSYSEMHESGKDKYFARDATLGYNTTLPPTALVRKTVPSELTFERMSVSGIRPSELSTMAQAQQLIMKIGSTVFALRPTQMAILREFAASVIPAGGVLEETKIANLPPDVPTDDNKAPLATTLAWLAKTLEKNSPAKEPINSYKIEAIEFKSCQISYRRVPTIRTSAVSNKLVYLIQEYHLNLGDLNPETVSVGNLRDYSSVFFSTRNSERKIENLSRSNDNGFTGRVLEDKWYPSAYMAISNATAATQIKAAFVHAINLCQAKP